MTGQAIEERHRTRAELAAAYRVATLDDPTAPVPLVATDPTAEDVAVARSRTASLHAAMEKVLTVRQSEIMRLRLSGMKLDEIAQVKGCSMPAISHVIKVATGKLTSHMQHRVEAA